MSFRLVYHRLESRHCRREASLVGILITCTIINQRTAFALFVSSMAHSPLETTVSFLSLHIALIDLCNLGRAGRLIQGVNEVLHGILIALSFANDSAIAGILGVASDVKIFRFANSPRAERTSVKSTSATEELDVTGN